jgi:transposase-like protein
MLHSRHFKAIYNEYLESGLTVRGYCKNHQITESKFYYWQNKLKKELPPAKGFVPVVFEEEQENIPSQLPVPSNIRNKPFAKREEANQPVSCEINYPNGVSLKLNGVTDPGLLRSLLVLLPQ